MFPYKCSITNYKKDLYCISIRLNGERYRYYSGEAIGEEDKPNLLPLKQRRRGFEELLIKFHIALRHGWVPIKESERNKEILNPTIETAYLLLERKKNIISDSYYRKLLYLIKCLSKYDSKDFSSEAIDTFFEDHPNWSNTSFNTFRRHIGVLESWMKPYGYQGDFLKKYKRRRQTEVLHKRIYNIQAVMDDIEQFDKNLHLCCLLSFGCLLRPHREIRELRWGDFNEDLTMISLAGNRNKSKRNRLVPVPEYIRKHLRKGPSTFNLFTNSEDEFNRFYFATLWRRYRLQSNLVGAGQTLYSFRHTGAIAIYEKSKNLKLLQTLMGHSDLQVSITYLRGLELQTINVEDMPHL